MARKFKIDKAAYEAMDDAGKADYIRIGETDEYRLDVEGYDDPAELRRARDREKETAAQALRDLETTRTELNGLKTGNARKDGDIAALENSWKTERDRVVGEKDKEIADKDKIIVRIFKTNVAKEMSIKISTVPMAMERLIADRLTVEFVNGEPVTRVLDKSGQPSALTVEQLREEMVANPDLAGMIIGSKASGSGANGNNGGGAPTKELKDMGDTERTEWAQRDPKGFEAAVAAQNPNR